MNDIKEAAARLKRSIEVARERARDAGDPGAEGIGSDAYAVASWVLSGATGPTTADVDRIRSCADALASALSTMVYVANQAIAGFIGVVGEREPPDDPPTAPESPDAKCAASPIDPAEPRQLVVPGSEGPPAKTSRALEIETPIEGWEPPGETLLEYTASGAMDLARFIDLVREFHRAHEGQSRKRWAPIFRAWMKSRQAAAAASATAPST